MPGQMVTTDIDSTTQYTWENVFSDCKKTYNLADVDILESFATNMFDRVSAIELCASTADENGYNQFQLYKPKGDSNWYCALIDTKANEQPKKDNQIAEVYVYDMTDAVSIDDTGSSTASPPSQAAKRAALRLH